MVSVEIRLVDCLLAWFGIYILPHPWKCASKRKLMTDMRHFLQVSANKSIRGALWLMPALLLLMPVSCAPQSVATKSAEVRPFYVYAQCTLMGGTARMEVPRNRPLVILWGWVASTEKQMQDYLQSAKVTVALDGKDLAGTMRGAVRYDESAEEYQAVWSADAGMPEAGTYILTYQVVFSAEVTDGSESFGPGTGRETISDECEIVMQ